MRSICSQPAWACWWWPRGCSPASAMSRRCCCCLPATSSGAAGCGPSSRRTGPCCSGPAPAPTSSPRSATTSPCAWAGACAGASSRPMWATPRPSWRRRRRTISAPAASRCSPIRSARSTRSCSWPAPTPAPRSTALRSPAAWAFSWRAWRSAGVYASFDTEWEPGAYLKEYYSEIEPEERETIAFFVDAMKDADRTQPALVFGVGADAASRLPGGGEGLRDSSRRISAGQPAGDRTLAGAGSRSARLAAVRANTRWNAKASTAPRPRRSPSARR